MSQPINHGSYTTDAVPIAGSKMPVQPATGAMHNFDVGVFNDLRNPLAPRGGIVNDGTTGASATALMTNQGVTTDSFSLTTFVKVPTDYSNAPGLIGLASAKTLFQNFSFTVFINTSGTLRILIYAGGASDYREVNLSGFGAAYAGKTVMLAFVRDSTVPSLTLYINGTAQTLAAATSGTPPTWAGSVTGTYLVLGTASNGSEWRSRMGATAVYNMTLTAADVIEIMAHGGLPPERFLCGSRVNKYPTGQAASFGTNDANTVGGGNANGMTVSVEAGARDGGAGAYFLRTTKTGTGGEEFNRWNLSMGTLKWGQAVRIRLWMRSNLNGAVAGLRPCNNGGQQISPAQTTALTTSWVQYTFTFLASTRAENFDVLAFTVASAAVGTNVDYDDLEVEYLGALAVWPTDDGYGFQLQDIGTNRLHMLLTNTGIQHTIPSVGPVRLRLVTDGTTSAQQLTAQAILPANIQILRIRARSQSGTPNLILGTSSGGTQIVASVALSTTWKDLTIALTGGMVTALSSLWATASAANVVELDITYEPITF